MGITTAADVALRGRVTSEARSGAGGVSRPASGDTRRGALRVARLAVLTAACSLTWAVYGQEAPAPAPPPGPTVLPPNIVVMHVPLSHTDPATCLQMLQIYGYSVCQSGAPLDPATLPAVMVKPGSQNHGLPDPATKVFPQTDTDTLMELLVFYDRNEPDQVSNLLDRIRTDIDVPARQIMIEVMVLEISSGALNELGVQWELDRGALSPGNVFSKYTKGDLLLGTLDQPRFDVDVDPTLDITFDHIFGKFEAQLQALIMNRAARVLSRPSVLTLDNRMAFINVAEKIPVAQSTFAGNGNFTSINFREVTAGIELTVRPRISEDGDEVGMQVAASVTARKPGEDVEIVEPNSDTVLAYAPTISVREVKTYARIANNTPFIIGGLVAQDDTQTERKVPLLGDIPYLGTLFRTKQDIDTRREVIIVITPHVVPDDRTVARNLPKDADDFDSFGTELFRDAYRLRAEDVFNLKFLDRNSQLRGLQSAADRVLADHISLSDVYPFNRFAGGRIPGEDILVYRQIYEVIKRKDLAAPVDDGKLIFLKPQEGDSGLGVGRLSKEVAKLAESVEGFENFLPPATGAEKRARGETVRKATKALALTFTVREEGKDARDVMSEPVPEISVVDCPDRDAWQETLWRMSQPEAGTGRKRYTILLQNEDDLVRLKRSIIVRLAVDLNAGNRDLTLQNFTLGHILLMPTVKADKVYLIDTEVAKYFFLTEVYYRAVEAELDKDVRAFREILAQPGYSQYAPEAVPAKKE